MEKSQFDNYIDGVVKICRQKSNRTDFNAKISSKTQDDLKVIEKLNFQEKAKRVQDFTFAEQNGFELTMKIKVRKVKRITSKHVAVIENYMYSIKHIDSDKKNFYLYLEGAKELE